MQGCHLTEGDTMPRINHNIQSMITAGSLKRTERSLSGTLEKLSTGLKINRASDDAAGLSVSEQLRSQAHGLEMGNRNISDGVALMNIAEGALNEVGGMLQRMRELAIQSSNDSLRDPDRNYIQLEIDQLREEIDRITASTQYNKMPLLNGSGVNGSVWGTSTGGAIHAGPNSDPNTDILRVTIDPMNTASLSIDSNSMSMISQTDSTLAITSLDTALTSVNELRAKLGAVTNRLTHALTNQENVHVNVSSAESMIRDVDFATESAEFTKFQILQQSATSMLSQANSLPNNVLSLLQG